MSESHMTDCDHKDQVAHLVDRFEQWKGYECPYCEIDRLRSTIRGWIKENSAGGWIDQLRAENAQLRQWYAEVIASVAPERLQSMPASSIDAGQS